MRKTFTAIVAVALTAAMPLAAQAATSKQEHIGVGAGAVIGAAAGGPVGLIVGAAVGAGIGYRFLPDDKGKVKTFHYWAMSMGLPQ